MKSRPKNRALMYERRSDDSQEASFRQQFDWAKAKSVAMGVPFRGTYADIEEMQRKRLNNIKDIYLDDAISGGDLTRPGLRKFFDDAINDKTVSHVYVFKRDRLGRPQGLFEMMGLEHRLVSSGVTLVTHDRIYTPEDIKDNELMYVLGGFVEYQEHGKFSPRLGDRMIFIQAAMAAKGDVPLDNAQTLIHEPSRRGLAALYKKAEMPAALYGAVRAAGEVVDETGFDGNDRDVERFRSRVIARVLTQVDDVEASDADYLLGKLGDVLVHAAA